MVPWTQVREPPLWGKCLTDLTSEFTHFILVIRLSKVKQPALRFFTSFLRSPAVPAVLMNPGNCIPIEWNRSEHPETSAFAAISQRQCIISRMMSEAGTRLSGVVSFLLMVVWWGETYCASNSLELVQPFYANWGKTWLRSRLRE